MSQALCLTISLPPRDPPGKNSSDPIFQSLLMEPCRLLGMGVEQMIPKLNMIEYIGTEMGFGPGSRRIQHPGLSVSKLSLFASVNSSADSLNVLTGAGWSQASRKTQPSSAAWEPLHRHIPLRHLLARQASFPPLAAASTQHSPQAPQELSPHSRPPPSCHLLGRVLASLCPGAGTAPWQHTGLHAGLPGEHV